MYRFLPYGHPFAYMAVTTPVQSNDTTATRPTTYAAAAASAAPPAGSLAPVDEEVYENQRYMPLRGWGAGNLLPTERKRYSRAGHSYSTFPLVPLPPGWEWEGPWQAETAGERFSVCQ